MSFRKKLIALAVMALVVVGAVFVGRDHNAAVEAAKNNPNDNTDTLYVWYSDPEMTDLFLNAAVAFHERYAGVRVVPMLVESSDYLENINSASVAGEKFPDVYVISNESLEKAYLAGLASEITEKGLFWDGHFSKGAQDAVLYKGKYVAYPMAFETSVLLYNKTLLQNWADRVNAGESASAGEGLSASEMSEIPDDAEPVIENETEGTGEAEQKVVTFEDYVPKTVQDILDFADAYEPEEGVENIFKWDVADIFYNYFFVGGYLVLGGDAGDDQEQINIYNKDTLDCLAVYQKLNQFFSIEAKTSKADTVLEEFLDGKLVYTIATSNAIAKIDEANKAAEKKYRDELNAAKSHNLDILDENGDESELIDLESIEKPMEYGYALVPDVSDTLVSRSLSVTETLAVNGYSEHKLMANRFASFVASTYAKQIYPRTGRLSACLDAAYTDEGKIMYQQEYARSIPLPKIVESSNFWVQLEIMFQKIWEAEDADTLLKDLDKQIRTQISD